MAETCPSDSHTVVVEKMESQFSCLVDRLRGGDPEAADTFLRQYEKALRREVRFLLLDGRLRRVVSESDVCQSVMARFFVGLWSGKYEFRNPEELLALLRKMVRARVCDLARHWRAQRRDIRKNVSMDQIDGLPGEQRRSPTPSRIVANAELLSQVEQRLTGQEQEILRLRQDRTSWAEIAKRLGQTRSPEAVRKQYERAIARVCRELGIEDEL